jgi:phage terminase large subunit-like protein
MGLRGIGAARLKQARDAAPARKRRLPWERKGRTRPQRIIAFLEWLPVTKGILSGRRMKLLPDQLEFIHAVYGPAKPDGRRRVALAIKSAAKGNGKTGLCAGLALAHLVGPEGEPRGEIYSASIDGVHARRLFSEMEAMILQRPELAALLNVQRFRSRIEVMSGPALGSIYEALSADGRKAQGLAPSLWIFDELAQVEDRTLLDGLMESTGKRSEGLGIVISTQARSDEHPLSQLIDDGLTGNDRSVFVHLLAAPDDADPFDDEVLRSVNPAWGKFLDLDDLRRSQDRARRMPAFEPAFRNLRLNQRVDANSDNRIVTVPVWQQGAAMINRNVLARRPCYGALDLSGKIDLTSFVLAFPGEQPEPVFSLLPAGDVTSPLCTPPLAERVDDLPVRGVRECLHGAGPNIAHSPELQDEAGRNRIVGRLVDPHDVVVAHGQVERLELSAHVLQRLLGSIEAPGRLLGRADTLIDPLRKHDVGRHGGPPFATRRLRANTARVTRRLAAFKLGSRALHCR